MSAMSHFVRLLLLQPCLLTLAIGLCAPTDRATAAVAASNGTVMPGDYAQRVEVRAFIAELVQGEGFDAASLQRLFSQVRYQPQVVAAMSRPVVSPPKWFEFAPQFLSPRRVEGGVAFWDEHAAVLQKAQDEFGVPAEVIVAIIGVETFYGRY